MELWQKSFPFCYVIANNILWFDTHLQIQGQVGVHQVVILTQIVFNRHLWKQKKLSDKKSLLRILLILFYPEVLGSFNIHKTRGERWSRGCKGRMEKRERFCLFFG